jgi:SMI1-KNR4 cell-wall
MPFKNVLNAPDDRLIARFEADNRVKLPLDYLEFLRHANGAVPEPKTFDLNAGDRVVERFLPLLADPAAHPAGGYDINVVITQIGERLASDPDELGCKLIPVAALFAGDFVCLDFRSDAAHPPVVLWDHERSDEFAPAVAPVADSFGAFLKLLH